MDVSGEPSAQPHSAPDRQHVVLLVDNHRDTLDSIAMVAAKELGAVRLITAASGQEGLAILAKEHVDLIITDFNLPGMNGIEFLRQARDMWPGISNLMFMATTSGDLGQSGREKFIDAVLSKSSGVEALLRAIAESSGHDWSP